MALLVPPAWLENSADHNAQDYRVVLGSLVTSGVADRSAFRVTEKAGTPDLSVDVAAGGAFIASTRSSAQGVYHAYNDAVVNVPLAAADPTNPRIDRILLQVRDEAQDAALSQNDARIYVEQGTPAAVPEAPSVTIADYIELAQVTVPASATSVTNANIADHRTLGRVRSQITKSDEAERIAGDRTSQSSSYTNVDTSIDLVVAADVGDRLLIFVNGQWGNESVRGDLTAVTVVGGSPVNDIGGTQGVAGWTGWSGVYTSIGAPIFYNVVAGDLSVGTVTLRLRFKGSSSSSKILRASATNPLNWGVVNLGPYAAA